MNQLITTQGKTKSLAVADQTAPPGQYLTFMLGGEVFAIGILNIKEIIDFGNLTEVPMMPVFVRGVINLRGSVVPVIDLSARFGRQSTKIARRTGIVIVETNHQSHSEEVTSHQDIGIIVDAVNEVIEIDSKDIEPAPAFGTKIRPDFINGMAKHQQGFIILLNVNQVLSVDEMAAIGEVELQHHDLNLAKP
jgi:purine-binding chemotaxis protein CheW